MAINLLEEAPHMGCYLTARLCEEAGVCLVRDEKTGVPESLGNRVEMALAEYDIHNGLVVGDRDGRRWRLRIAAEELPS